MSTFAYLKHCFREYFVITVIIFSILWLLLGLLGVLRLYIYSSILKSKNDYLHSLCKLHCCEVINKKSEPKVEIVGPIARHVSQIQDVSNLMA